MLNIHKPGCLYDTAICKNKVDYQKQKTYEIQTNICKDPLKIKINK